MMQEPGNALGEVLLERLQDIHPAAEPSWWPPAPGWWLLAAVVLAALVYASLRGARQLRLRLRRRRLLRQLDGLAAAFDPGSQPAAYLAALNRLFRAIALRAFPGSGCARLQGRDWVAFIRARLPGDAGAPALDALASGPYQPRPEFDPAALRAHARLWILSHG